MGAGLAGSKTDKVPWLDRAISQVFPKWGFGRARYRLARNIVERTQKTRGASYRHSQGTRTRRRRGGLAGSADAHLDGLERRDLVDRSRDLERNNALADGMLDRAVDNIVGTGSFPQARTGDEAFDGLAEARFREWAESDADIRGQLTFWQMQRLGVRSVLRDGDVGFIKAGTTLQAVEEDRILTPREKGNDEHFVQGVEMNRVGKPIRYWVAGYAGRHTLVNQADMAGVPAQNFIHLYDPKRFSQSRGCPIWSSCLGYFEILDQYIEAELVGAQVAACLSAYINTKDPTALAGGGYVSSVADAGDEDHAVMEMEPGMVYHLDETGEVTVVDPSKPPKQFPDFVSAILRFLGLPMGLPIELVSLDYQKSSYGASRLALLQAYRTFRAKQMVLKFGLLVPVWRWKIAQFIESKELPKPKSATPFRHEWLMPGWEWIDPLAEARANALGLDRGMVTLQEIARQKGVDVSELMIQRAKEIEMAKAWAKKYGVENWKVLLRADTGTEPAWATADLIQRASTGGNE